MFEQQWHSDKERGSIKGSVNFIDRMYTQAQKGRARKLEGGRGGGAIKVHYKYGAY